MSKIDPELIQGLEKLNNAVFNFLAKADKGAEKGIDRAKKDSLRKVLGVEKEPFDKLQKARETIFNYLGDLSCKADEILGQYKK